MEDTKITIKNGMGMKTREREREYGNGERRTISNHMLRNNHGVWTIEMQGRASELRQ